MNPHFLQQAMQWQQEGRLEDAIELYHQLLAQFPDNEDVLHGLGLAYAQAKNYPKAITLLKQAVTLAPHIPGFHNNLANAYKRVGNFDSALQHYQQALKLKSPYPQAENNLGALLFKQGRVQEAIVHLERAIRMDPQFIDAHYNLANCYAHQERLIDAHSHYQLVLKHAPDHLGALHNVGIVLTGLKEFEKAKLPLEKTIQREPDNVDALFHLALILASQEDLNGAKALYEKVIDLNPHHGQAHHNLATILLHLKTPDIALKHYQTAYSLMPENKTALHMIHALTGDQNIEQAPLEYVRALFDQYAVNYDDHLKSQLNYQVPHYMRQTIAPYLQEHTHPLRVLDMGCGTGLLAPYFRDVAGKFYGSDLSPNMIQIAQKQGGYDELYTEDLLTTLSRYTCELDLILAADVFGYMGQLASTFLACEKALVTIGLLCFSIEYLEAKESEPHASKGFLLTSSGRFAHCPHYIRTLSAEYGFEVLKQHNIVLRQQEGQNVQGGIFILKKSK